MAKIMVIEDQTVLLEEILDFLRFEGHEAFGAVNGRIGIEQIQIHRPNLIISDIMMPEMDGYQVLEQLRNDPATATIPFLFLSAKAEYHDTRRGMRLGADDYLTKPFMRDDLITAINARLRHESMVKQHSDADMETLRQNLIHMLPHELRTPLVGILGYGEILALNAATLRPDELTAMGEDIIMAGQSLQRLTENYLYYAQLEIVCRDKQKMEHWQESRTDQIGSIIKLAVDELAVRYGRAADVVISTVECTAHIGAIDLKKLAYELVDNAFKFSQAGAQVTITSAYAQGTFSLCVEDQGRGMANTDTEHIGAYMQFGRDVHEQQGVGLGLAIVTRLMDVYGGSVSINSEPGRGACICVKLAAE